MLVAAVIPAYNEARSLCEVVRRTSRYVDRVYVVDDGSSDGTSRVDARVIRHDRNRGKGAALRTGFRVAIREGADAIVTLDGDGQHDPAWIPTLLASFAEADLVVGCRARRGPMPFPRILSNGFSSVLISLLTRRRLGDVHSGLRVYRARRLAALEIRSRRFEVEVELVLKAARAGWRIVHVPVPTLYGSERSKISPVLDAARFLRAAILHGLGPSPWTSRAPASGWSGSSLPAAACAIRAS